MLKYNLKKKCDDFVSSLQSLFKFIVQILKILTDFLRSCGKFLPDFSDGKTLSKALLNVLFYSKVITLTSMAIPVPVPVLEISTEIWVGVEYCFAQLRLFFTHIEELITESKVKSNNIDGLNRELEDLRQSIKFNNTETENQNDMFRTEINGLKTQLIREHGLTEKVVMENNELTNQLKVSKLTTQIDSVNKWFSVITTTALIGKEIYRFFKPLDPISNDLTEILSMLNNLQARFRREDIQETVNRRRSGQEGGLAPGNISLDDIDDAN